MALAPERHRHRQAPTRRETGQIIAGLLVPQCPAHHQHRPACLRQSPGDRRDLCLADRRGRRSHRRNVRDIGMGRQHIFGQCENDRAGPARHGHMEGARDVFGQALDPFHLCHPFRERAEHGAVIDLLKGLAVAMPPVDLSHEQDHGRRVLTSDMNTC